uniref:SF3 helicase domain-containing protein n=1 Tax=viral metagenome TaxID=1070528 RepID=A0A6C0EQ65_9ZZZZ
MNNTMIKSSQFKDLNEFLAKHSAKNDKNTPSTHTRIPDSELGIHPGSYIIPKEELSLFYNLYYDNVFVKKRKEYLTERQSEKGGTIAVDFDFRYNYDVDSRQHTREHIQDMVVVYLEEIKSYFIFEENKSFDVFIFEKPNINRLTDGSLTKDGIHMLIGIQMDHIMQLMLREKMIGKLQEIWDLPLINTWDSVLDEGISTGKTNWQLFGSRKPGNEAYELTQHFVISYDKSDGEFSMDEKKVQDFDLKSNFMKLSVQYDNNARFEINPKIIDEYNKRLESKGNKIKKPSSRTKINLLVEEDDNDEENQISLSDIKNKETLERAVNLMLKRLKPNEYEIKETHEYAQILPEKYYEPGSHLLNRQVAFALKHTDERLFLSWVMLRSKASDFDYDTIPELYHQWKKYFSSSKQDPVTRRSIMYWAKQDNFEGYERVKKSTIDYFIEESINSQTEYDKALVLKQMYKDKYVCVSYEKKGCWYVFKNHRWVFDKGLSLREAISKQMHDLYSSRRDELDHEYQHYDKDDDRAEFLKKKVKILSEIMLTLKRTNDKNNIMREAAELFYDGDFVKEMDKNKYLLCFNNGVVDFNKKIFRDGYPDDYITKTTKINYIPYNLDNPEISKTSAELLTFMEKLFPIPDLNRYMWDHLASCLIGSGKNQCFNVYHGSGSNGKSILTDLMSVTLGEYKGTVPITLVTEKRGLIGGTSDEVLKLKGVRYAVMQEPSKGVKLNEGIMKELTGGDPIQARGLYSESEIFEPQFNLVVCTNNLFDIDSNDDGTWRRIKKDDFLSKFIDEGEEYNDETPYVFTKDKTLKDRLPLLAPTFASMLVKRAFETDGIVVDCETVINASNKYRRGQDHIAAFISEKIIKTGNKNDKIGKNGLYTEFKIWFQQEQGARKVPKGQELYDFMDKKFGIHTSKGWLGLQFNQPEEENDEVNDI